MYLIDSAGPKTQKPIILVYQSYLGGVDSRSVVRAGTQCFNLYMQVRAHTSLERTNVPLISARISTQFHHPRYQKYKLCAMLWHLHSILHSRPF